MKKTGFWVGILLLAVLMLWMGIRLRALIGLLLWAVVLAYLLLPLAQHWERFLPRSSAAAASLITVLLAAGILTALVVPGLVKQAQGLAMQLPGMISWLLEGIKNTESWLQTRLGLSLTLSSRWTGESITDAAFVWLSSLRLPDTGALSHVLLVPLMSGYILADREALLCGVQYLIPVRWRGEVSRVTERIHRGLAGYIRGQLWVAIFVGALTGMGLYACQIPYALILGLSMTVCNVIPFFGPLLGTIPIVIVAAAAGGKRLLAALIVVIVVQQLDNLFISPRVMGSNLKMKPLPVMVSVLAGGMLAGMAGMLLALPVVIILREWVGYFMDRMTLPRIKVTD